MPLTCSEREMWENVWNLIHSILTSKSRNRNVTGERIVKGIDSSTLTIGEVQQGEQHVVLIWVSASGGNTWRRDSPTHIPHSRFQ